VPAVEITATENVVADLRYWSFTDRENADWGDADIVFQGSYAPDYLGEIHLDFNELYAAYLKTSIPANGTSYNQENNIGVFHLTLIGSVSGSIVVNPSLTWYVCNAKLKSSTAFQVWSQSNFLTNQPIERPTNYEAKEWLTYLDLVGDYNVIGRFYPKEGGLVDCIVRSDEAIGCYSVDVSYALLIPMVARLPHQLKGYYDIILMDGNLQEICRQRYIYEERTGREHYFLFVNALGGIDTLICNGANVLQPEVTHNIGRFGRQYKALDDTEDYRHWQQDTGLLPHRWRNWIHDLLSSKQAACRYNQEDDTMNPIVVDESEIGMSDAGQLASATFGYMMTEVDNVMADTERALERSSLHASVAEQAEDLHDETAQVVLVFDDDGNGGSETKEVEIAASKLYVEFEPTKSTTIYYAIDGKLVGDFDPSEDTSPIIISKDEKSTIQFSSQDFVLGQVVVSYYPVTIKALNHGTNS
jgi:hypothetical protein